MSLKNSICRTKTTNLNNFEEKLDKTIDKKIIML